MVDVDQVAEDLYRLDPAEFTAERDRRAAEARRDGDRALAAAIKQLRRPSTAAWAVNLIANECADDLNGLIAIGARLRVAQTARSADAVRSLSRQRQQTVTGLARQATTLALRLGKPISEPAEREIRATLEAVVADAEAATAVLSGRLVRSLEYSGFGPVDLTDTVGGPAPTPAIMEEQSKGEAQLAEAAVQEAEADLQSAQQRLISAESEVRRLEDELAVARRVADDAAAAADAAGHALAEANTAFTDSHRGREKAH
jgi:hypothetical protein